jgi:hypothetical protein
MGKRTKLTVFLQSQAFTTDKCSFYYKNVVNIYYRYNFITKLHTLLR